jgi:hypothetical protein
VKIRLRPVNKSRQKIWRIYGFIGLAFLVTARYTDNMAAWMPPCPFHALTGIPCPICGATRSGINLANLHWSRAFYGNPLFFILYLFLIIWGICSLALLPVHQTLSVELNEKERKAAAKLPVIVLLLNWAYLIIRAI